MNQTIFEYMRDATGCGEHFPENRTLDECLNTVYAGKIKNKSAEEIKSMWNEISRKFQSSLSTLGIDASKREQIEHVLQKYVMFMDLNANSSNKTTVSIDLL